MTYAYLIEREDQENPDCVTGMFIGYVETGTKGMAKFITWTSVELAIRFVREQDAKNMAEALSRLIPRLGIQHGVIVNEHEWD